MNPIIRDNDRKAAEESLGERAAEMIERLYDPGPIPGPEPTDLDYEVVNLCDELRGPNTLIIARHHAEEGAAEQTIGSLQRRISELNEIRVRVVDERDGLKAVVEKVKTIGEKWIQLKRDSEKPHDFANPEPRNLVLHLAAEEQQLILALTALLTAEVIEDRPACEPDATLYKKLFEQRDSEHSATLAAAVKIEEERNALARKVERLEKEIKNLKFLLSEAVDTQSPTP